MLTLVLKLGGWLYRWQWLLAAVALASGVTFVTGLVVANASRGPVVLALTTLLWSVLLLAIARSFANAPPPIEQAAGIAERIRIRIWRGTLSVLAVATAALTVALIWLTIRVLTVACC